MKSVKHHSGLTQTLVRSLAFFLVLLVSFSAFSQDVDEARQKEGKKLFKSLCASCHKLDKKLVGPKLGDVESRRENAWLKSWIKDNAAFRASGDKDAIEVFEEYNKAGMSAFTQLTDKNIDDILYYTTVGEIKKATDVAVAADGVSTEKGEAPGWLIYILGAAIIVAFLIIASLLKTIS
ncbi:c-type cytochrome, partial [Tenacibaculum piscium]